ncbi:hypothetical protein [Aquimarina algiphila]|uniref:Uncharacterized protein n=1 Tax=Aquimarina algiphila TaxID=2047982 RepID=A0A554VEI6_9FLAO|nr:hypothetical protein [Aquimarina algiphila]TSE05432.1 hypothetical protein FOF46_22985 [Aquimarina algiphila]
MKKVKNYIAPDLAKKKIARYKYWNIKDESGISITSSEDITDGRSFGEVLDSIIADNVDAEVQVKFGTNEQSSRQNAPIFIRVNETIEWVEPEEDETIKINGIPHKMDKNGNVNINLNNPQAETPIIESPNDIMRQEMEIQLEGLRKESELKEQRYQADLHNKLAEQTLKFKEMMLADREARIAEREQDLATKEAILGEKEAEMGEGLKGYVKLIPSTLGGVVTEWLKGNPFGTKATGLGTTENKPKRTPKPQNPVQFSIDNDTPPEPELQEPTDYDISDDDLFDIEVHDAEQVSEVLPEPQQPEIEILPEEIEKEEQEIIETPNTTDNEEL